MEFHGDKTVVDGVKNIALKNHNTLSDFLQCKTNKSSGILVIHSTCIFFSVNFLMWWWLWYMSLLFTTVFLYWSVTYLPFHLDLGNITSFFWTEVKCHTTVCIISFCCSHVLLKFLSLVINKMGSTIMQESTTLIFKVLNLQESYI